MKVILIVGLLILFAVLLTFSIWYTVNKIEDSTEGNTGLKIFLSWIPSVVAFVLFLIIPFSIHQINAGEIAVVKVWGEAKETRTPGMYFDFWVSKKYEIYDSKVQQTEVNTQTYSSDGQTMDIELVVQYQIQQDKILEIAVNYGGLEMLESRIKTVATEKMKSVLSQKQAMTIIETRKDVSPDVEASIRNAITNDYFVNIVSVVLTDISFTDAFEQTVENKMIAEQEKLRAEYEKERQIIQAEADLEVAKKKAQEQIAKAQAEAESIELKAEAEAQALAILQETWNSIPEEIREIILREKAITTWNGELPETLVGDEFLRYLLGIIGE